MYTITIETLGRRSTRGTATNYGAEVVTCADLAEVRKELRGRYGRLPGARRKVYRSVYGKMIVVGFTHTYWIAVHNGNSKWSEYCTDCITVQEQIVRDVYPSEYLGAEMQKGE